MLSVNKNWESLIKATKPVCTASAKNPNMSKIEIAPFERGMGITIGNALRRILLSSLQGSAITGIKIPGVTHELSPVVGVKEDLIDIILNLKTLPIKIHSDKKQIITIDVTGPCVVTASMIEAPSSVEILDPRHVICSVSEGQHFHMEMYCETGRGYMEAKREESESSQHLGLIPIDALFSPVKKVSYQVKNVRIGQITDYDRLVMMIETDGSLSPDHAVELAARILQDQLQPIINFEDDVVHKKETSSDISFDPVLMQKVEDLELTVRTRNCMSHANIVYIGDLASSTEQQMLGIQNFGRKSLNELRDILSGFGLKFGMEIPDWPPENIEELAKKYTGPF